ncbi:hypothetical protein U1Q18_036246 [Sarracenia purpurea var. burkii]
MELYHGQVSTRAANSGSPTWHSRNICSKIGTRISNMAANCKNCKAPKPPVVLEGNAVHEANPVAPDSHEWSTVNKKEVPMVKASCAIRQQAKWIKPETIVKPKVDLIFDDAATKDESKKYNRSNGQGVIEDAGIVAVSLCASKVNV